MFFLFCSIRVLYCCFGLYVAAAHYFVCYLGLRVVFLRGGIGDDVSKDLCLFC